jgi:DNA-binding transcriptional LysR family regulator
MRSTLMASQPITVVAAKSLALGDGPKRLADLAGQGWVLSHDGCGMRLGLNRALGAAGLPFNLAVEAFGSELQLSLVARGLGIGLSTPDALRRSAYRESLREIEVTDFHSRVEVWFLHGTLPGRLVRPVEMLLDSLSGTLRDAGLDMHL